MQKQKQQQPPSVLTTGNKREKQVKKTTNNNNSNTQAGGKTDNQTKSGNAQNSSKSSSKHDKNQKKGVAEEEPNKLQAILLADSFSKTLRPVSLEGPKVLLPLVNIPMLEYSLEFLAQNGVEEVFVFCVWYAERVEQYIKSSRWPSILSIKCITSSACSSAGDALRELDALSVIRSDPFILISGDVISNISLKKAIAFHQQKKKDDSNNVMTVVLKKVQKTAGAKPILDDLVVAQDRITNQIVLFEDSYQKKNVQISLEIMKDRSGLTFHTDLLDCNVDICSPELMFQFSENFDYQDIRTDFIHNEVGNWSLGKHIYGYIIENEYAARVQDFRTYHSICRDIVTRWVFPMVPDAFFDGNYTQSNRYIYKEAGVKVARTANIEEGVVLGRGTRVEEMAKLRRTIVGMDCLIGARSVIDECHIWKGAQIESDVNIRQSIVCNGAVIKSGAVIPRGCIISYGVVVGAGVVLPEFSRLTTFTEKEETEDEFYSPKPSKAMNDQDMVVPSATESTVETTELGLEGKGHFWHPPDCGIEMEVSDDDEVEGIQHEKVKSMKIDPFRARSIGCVEEEELKRCLWYNLPLPVEEEEDDNDEEENEFDIQTSSVHNEMANAFESMNGDQFDAGMEKFYRVLGDMVNTGYMEGHKADSVLMDIRSYKLAQDKSFSQCLIGIIPVIISLVWNQTSTTKEEKYSPPSEWNSAMLSPKDFLASLKSLLKCNGWCFELITNMLLDETTQVAIILSFELLSIKSKYLYNVFRFLIQIFYDGDIITEDGIRRWISLRKQGVCGYDIEDDYYNLANENATAILKLFSEPSTQEFVNWIEQDAEDEDEEETEAEDEGDDET